MMRSNFSAARGHLEHAYTHLSGDDETSERMRQALGILIDALIAMQFRPEAQVLPFPDQRCRNVATGEALPQAAESRRRWGRWPGKSE